MRHAATAAVFIGSALAISAAGQTPDVPELKRTADGVLAKPAAEALREIDRVWELVDALKAPEDAALRLDYLTKGAAVSPDDVPRRLQLAKTLYDRGRLPEAEPHAKFVIERAEEDALRVEAGRIAWKRFEFALRDLEEAKPETPALTLVVASDENAMLMEEVRAAVAKELGAPADLRLLDFRPPAPRRDFKAAWLAYARGVMDSRGGSAEFAEALRRTGRRERDLQDDDATAEIYRAFLRLSKLDKELQAFEAAYRRGLATGPQCDASEVLAAFEKEAKDYLAPGRRLVFVCRTDLFLNQADWVFGKSKAPLAVMSYARFRGAANGEPQDRARLVRRMTVYAMTAAGRACDLPACKEESCVRAPATDVAKLDKKPTSPCAACRAAFAEALRKK